MKYVRLKYENNKFTNSSLKCYQEIIDTYVLKDYKYIGFMPVKFDSNGKTVEIDLIFEEKKDPSN